MAHENRRVSVRHDGESVTIGVDATVGAERYDGESGHLYREITIPQADFDAAVKASSKKASESYVDDGLKPKIDPSDHRADSSPRSEDRPPVRISSETNPQPANPTPSDEAQANDLPRGKDGIADIPANVETKAQLNVAVPPKDVKKGAAKGGKTATERKADADAKVAKEHPTTLSPREIGRDAAREAREAQADSPSK